LAGLIFRFLPSILFLTIQEKVMIHTSCISSDDDDDVKLLFPPPRKILRRGTPELELALQKGEVSLSLPQEEVASWMGRELKSSGEKKKKKQDKTRFCDIIGHNAVKLRLEEVLLPLALPQQLSDSILTGIRSSTASILLFGPPGCGKTQLAKAVAGEASAAFLSVGPSDILSKFVGESEASIRNLFRKARTMASQQESKCAVLFLDEIDALGQSRASSATDQNNNDGCSRCVLAELLIQLNYINSRTINSPLQEEEEADDDDSGETLKMKDKPSYISSSDDDDFLTATAGNDVPFVETIHDHDRKKKTKNKKRNSQIRIIFVAATNRPQDCDPALIRRFSVKLIVGLPSPRDRNKILARYLEGIETSITSLQLKHIASLTQGWSGSDLESLTREAAMAPVRNCIRSAARLKRKRRSSNEGLLLKEFQTLRPVSVLDFESAIQFWNRNHNANYSDAFLTSSFATENEDSHKSSSMLPLMVDDHYDSSSEEENED
jgi:SpoVK/Ycf46/Vps4 family AAA+-type ATPase